MLKIRKTANEIIDSVARVKESANEAINNITQAKDSFIQKGKDFFVLPTNIPTFALEIND